MERFGSQFTVEYISTGAHAHGFGITDDGRQYAFRVRGRTLVAEVYRHRSGQFVPGREDVIAEVRRSVTEIDLGDERSVVAVVRDAVADPVIGPGDQDREEGSTVRAVLERFGL